MLKHILYFQIVVTLACTHFAFAVGGADHRVADPPEIQRMSQPANNPRGYCDKDGAESCARKTPEVKTDNGVKMVASNANSRWGQISGLERMSASFRF